MVKVWEIPPDRIEAALTRNVAFGTLSAPRTNGGRAFRLEPSDMVASCAEGMVWLSLAEVRIGNFWPKSSLKGRLSWFVSTA